MRALVMTEPAPGSDRTAVTDVPAPRPGPGQVSIAVDHAGVNFLDVMARRGDPGYAPGWPFRPGLEVAGRVQAVGAGVTRFRPGARVAAFTSGGGFAEVVVADAASTTLLPDDVPTHLAAAAPLMLTSALLLLTDVTRLQPGEAVLMHSAAGGMGAAVAQLLPVLGGGLRVGTVGRPDKVDDALAAGWDVVLPRTGLDAEKLRGEAGGGVGVVLDPLGTAMLELDLAVTDPGGRIALFGNPGGGTPGPLPPLGRLIGGNVGIAGFSISKLVAAAPDRAAAALARVLGLVAEGRLAPQVTVVDGLAGAAEMHDLLVAGRGAGKYVVAVRR
jgi:NADPH2:quinone reductase